MANEPKFLVDWEPRWQGFKASFAPVFSRSMPKLDIECEGGLIEPRTAGASIVLHIAAIFCLVVLWPLFITLNEPELRFAPPNQYDIVYYNPAETPAIGDVGGARQGLSGRSGGQHAYNPSQTIRVARGENPAPLVASVPPKMKLPLSTQDLANLLVLGANLPQGPTKAELAALEKKNQEEAKKREPLKVATMTESHKPKAENSAAPAFSQFKRTVDNPNLEIKTSNTVKLAVNIDTQAANSGPQVLSEHAEPAIEREFVDQHAATKGGGGTSQEMGVGGDELQTAIVMSVRPGNTYGAPPNAIPGAFTASSAGRNELGMGTGNLGSGIGAGGGTGSGNVGIGSGSGSQGTGLGSNPNATGGITPGGGPGGAGYGGPGARRAGAGVSISGNTVLVPSFGTKGGPTSVTAGMKENRNAPTIIVVASARAGGGLSRYGELKGSKVYTTYLKTSAGAAILQYADPQSASGEFDEELTSPEPISLQMPDEVKMPHLVFSCVLTRKGAIEKLKVLEGPKTIPQKVLSAIQNWRFRPVIRGNEKVDVDAMLGFSIDTN